MVNPYAVNQAQRAPVKTQVSLGSSNALKKFEKFQSKYNPNMTSIERKKEKKKNKPAKGILDTTDEDDDSDDDDDSMIIRNANKFMKKKAPEVESVPDSSDDSDIEISAIDGSSTPNKPNNRAKSPAHPIINRSNNSSATSMRSMTHTHKRSQSKVKFMNDYSEDESTILDDMLSKNLIVDIEDLEAHTASLSAKAKSGKHRRGKSPISPHKRSESVTSIQEESILEESFNEDEEAASEAPSLTNLIMDIHDLEASISKLEKNEKKNQKKHRNRQDSESLSQRDKKSDKKSKSKKQVSTSIITTAFGKLNMT